jgi:hypothetical protein
VTPDIEARIVADFQEADREEGRAILRLLEDELGGIVPPRILRCVLFLSAGDMARLVDFADRALNDWRDVIYWAEYDERDHRLRDFNQPFPGS